MNIIQLKNKDITKEHLVRTSAIQEWRLVPGDKHLYFRNDHGDADWIMTVLPKTGSSIEEQDFSSIENLFPGKFYSIF